ncbi:MAG: ABC transporter permease, partial [Candidatus Methanomethylicaceae archaeon]
MNGGRTSMWQIRADLNAALAIAKKDMRIYYIKPGTLMFGILFPLFMFLSFAVGKNAPVAALIPGLISITALFSSSSIGPMVIPTERRVKTFERLVTAPISFFSVILGKTIGGFIFSTTICVIPLIIGLGWFEARIVNIASLIAGLMFPSFCFATMGIMFASFPTENPGDVMLLLNFVRLPLIFISGIFIPIESLPEWGQIVAIFSPLSYANDLIRHSLEGVTS